MSEDEYQEGSSEEDDEGEDGEAPSAPKEARKATAETAKRKRGEYKRFPDDVIGWLITKRVKAHSRFVKAGEGNEDTAKLCWKDIVRELREAAKESDDEDISKMWESITQETVAKKWSYVEKEAKKYFDKIAKGKSGSAAVKPPLLFRKTDTVKYLDQFFAKKLQHVNPPSTMSTNKAHGGRIVVDDGTRTVTPLGDLPKASDSGVTADAPKSKSKKRKTSADDEAGREELPDDAFPTPKSRKERVAAEESSTTPSESKGVGKGKLMRSLVDSQSRLAFTIDETLSAIANKPPPVFNITPMISLGGAAPPAPALAAPNTPDSSATMLKDAYDRLQNAQLSPQKLKKARANLFRDEALLKTITRREVAGGPFVISDDILADVLTNVIEC